VRVATDHGEAAEALAPLIVPQHLAALCDAPDGAPRRAKLRADATHVLRVLLADHVAIYSADADAVGGTDADTAGEAVRVGAVLATPAPAVAAGVAEGEGLLRTPDAMPAAGAHALITPLARLAARERVRPAQWALEAVEAGDGARAAPDGVAAARAAELQPLCPRRWLQNMR
jgi:hypothetical protein